MKYKYPKMPKTSINITERIEGETIEQKMMRVLQTKEPIKDGAPEIFTERKDGVLAAYNPRTDRFELAVEAMDYITRGKLAKREERMNPKTEEKTENNSKNIDLKEGKKDGGAESAVSE